jgi:fibrillarin-like pre-rRNA processing protein
MKELFKGVFEHEGRIFTLNAEKGFRFYGENLLEFQGKEYREWNPYRSKIAAAIKNGLKNFLIKQDSRILYLGAGSGTTISHLSDFMNKGFIFGIEISPIAIKKLVELAKIRNNIAPILGNARKPESYSHFIDRVDLIYQDIAQRDQCEILTRNAEFYLKKNDSVMLALKARSISSAKEADEIFKEEIEKLENRFEILEKVRLDPYEKEHLFLVMRMK